jgi:hypothetical protein
MPPAVINRGCNMSDVRQPAIADEFKEYAEFSVRVDRYYHAVNAYGRHHGGIQDIYQAMPSRDRLKGFVASATDEPLKRFLSIAASRLGHMATTGIFSNDSGHLKGEIPEDIVNFTFYTCYCFQWTLFEEFVKTMIRKVVDAKAINSIVTSNLESKWRHTKQFLDIIDSGAVFGKSPFSALLPVVGWVPSFEEVGYTQLNEIRELRNAFIHGIEGPEITPEPVGVKQQRYERSMWILRTFAGNVQWDVQRVLAVARE